MSLPGTRVSESLQSAGRVEQSKGRVYTAGFMGFIGLLVIYSYYFWVYRVHRFRGCRFFWRQMSC